MPVALVHARGEPRGGEVAGDLGAFQLDAGDHRARQRLAGAGLGQGIHARVQVGIAEVEPVAALECGADRTIVHPQRVGQPADRAFGLARRVQRCAGIQQVAVQGERHPGRDADGALECRIPAGVPAGVVVGEAMHLACVGRLVSQQVGDAEIQAAATGEYFVADAALDGIRIVRCVRFRKRNAHLHRPAGLHRVVVGEQPSAQRDAADQVLVDVAEVALRAYRAQPLGVAAPVG